MKKGYIIAIIMYIILCVIMHNIELKLNKEVKAVNNIEKQVIEVKKEAIEVKKQVKELTTNKYIKLKNGDKEQNEVVSYLWNKTHNIDIILTFYGESWLKSNTINNKNTNGTIDYGYCQLNNAYHKDYILSNNFKIMSSQLDYCVEVWNKAIKSGRIYTTFYAYKYRFNKRIRSQFYISQEAVDITYKK